MVCGFDKSKECSESCTYFRTCTRNELNKRSSVNKEKNVVKMQGNENLHDNDWLIDVLFEDDLEKHIKEELIKYSSIGLYVNQLSRLLSAPEEKIKKILSEVTWCKTEKKRYFYHDVSNDLNTKSKFTEPRDNEMITTEQVDSLTSEEKLKMMNEDIENLIKKLKIEKGIS